VRADAGCGVQAHANVSSDSATIRSSAALSGSSQQNVLFELRLEAHVFHRTLVAFAAVAALGCLPMATTALAAHGHAGRGGHVAAAHIGGGHVARYGGGHVGRYGGGHVARYGGGYVNGPIYDSCSGYGYGYGYGYGPGYGYGGCRGYGVPLVGGLINGVLGGY
jgi:hypothetical protein